MEKQVNYNNDTSSSSKQESWSFFDELRSHASLFQEKDERGINHLLISSVKTKEGSSVVEVTTNEQKTYRLCTLSVFIPLSWGISPHFLLLGMVKGSLMAARDFNAGIESVVSNLPTSTKSKDKCDIRLVVDIYDTGFAPLSASRVLTEEVLGNKHPYKTTAVVGAYRSTTSFPLAVLNSIFEIPQISTISASSELDNHKMFGRVVTTSAGIASAVVDFFLHITGGSISHFAVLHFHDEYGIDLRNNMADIASQHGIRVKGFALRYDKSKSSRIIDDDVIEGAVEEIAKSGLKYVYCGSHFWHVENLLRYAAHHKAAGPGFLWVFGESIRSKTFRSVRLHPEKDKDLVMAYQGSAHILTNYHGDENEGAYRRFSQEWRNLDGNEDFGQYFNSKKPQRSITPFPANFTFSQNPIKESSLSYDAVMALGLAACGINDERFFDGVTLFDSFKDTEFDGVTGRIKTDGRTGTRDHKTLSYSVSNIVVGPIDETGNITLNYNLEMIEEPGRLVRNGNSSSLEESPRWKQVGKGFNFSDFSFDPPDPLPPLNEDLGLIGTPLKVFGLTLGAIVLVSSVFFAWWTFRHRGSRVVQASQPVFLFLICVGAFIMGLSFVPLSFVPLSFEEPPMSKELMDFSCMAVWWSHSFGFVLTMTALFSKTWRINKIMNQRAFRRIKVRTNDVILPGIIILSANLVVLVAWTLIAPAKYERSYKFSFSFDRYGRSEQSVGICVSEEGSIVGQPFFLSILFMINGGVILIANYQAWEARAIATEFAESRFIGLAMIVLLQTLLIGAPVMAMSTHSSRSSYIMKSLSIFASSGVVLLLIFIPKFLYHRNYLAAKKKRTLGSDKKKRLSYDSWRSGRENVRFKFENEMGFNNNISGTKNSNRNQNIPRLTAGKGEEDEKSLRIIFRSEREEQQELKDLLIEARSIREELMQEGISLQSQLLQLEEDNLIT